MVLPLRFVVNKLQKQRSVSVSKRFVAAYPSASRVPSCGICNKSTLQAQSGKLKLKFQQVGYASVIGCALCIGCLAEFAHANETVRPI